MHFIIQTIKIIILLNNSRTTRALTEKNIFEFSQNIPRMEYHLLDLARTNKKIASDSNDESRGYGFSSNRSTIMSIDTEIDFIAEEILNTYIFLTDNSSIDLKGRILEHTLLFEDSNDLFIKPIEQCIDLACRFKPWQQKINKPNKVIENAFQAKNSLLTIIQSIELCNDWLLSQSRGNPSEIKEKLLDLEVNYVNLSRILGLLTDTL